MSIIANTYYHSDINLIAGTDGQLESVSESWQAIYEEIILKKLLGYDLYALYVADLATTPTTPQSPTLQRFKDLVDGKDLTFEVKGYTVSTRWIGLRDSTMLKSLIAYYVYYNYRNETESSNSGAGQILPLPENSTKADVRPKLINTWNKMIDWYGLTPNSIISKEYFLNTGNYRHYNSLASSYNFLLANIDTYPEWVFEPLEKQNIFGI